MSSLVGVGYLHSWHVQPFFGFVMGVFELREEMEYDEFVTLNNRSKNHALPKTQGFRHLGFQGFVQHWGAGVLACACVESLLPLFRFSTCLLPLFGLLQMLLSVHNTFIACSVYGLASHKRCD